jgi:hypothetical protein
LNDGIGIEGTERLRGDFGKLVMGDVDMNEVMNEVSSRIPSLVVVIYSPAPEQRALFLSLSDTIMLPVYRVNPFHEVRPSGFLMASRRRHDFRVITAGATEDP